MIKKTIGLMSTCPYCGRKVGIKGVQKVIKAYTLAKGKPRIDIHDAVLSPKCKHYDGYEQNIRTGVISHYFYK
jgi:DNA-directed RNA polymerase subunit RPC12/RpoP